MSLLSDDNTGSCTVFYLSKWQMQKKLPRKELQYTKCVLNSWLKCIPIILHFLELHSCCWYNKATKTEKIYIHTAEKLTLDLNWNLEHCRPCFERRSFGGLGILSLVAFIVLILLLNTSIFFWSIYLIKIIICKAIFLLRSY